VLVVALLLQDPRIDPTACCNSAIHSAIQLKKDEMARLLLDDGRVDPFAMNSRPFLVAIQNGMTAVVQELLKDDRCNVSLIKPEHLITSAQYGLDVIKLIWSDPRYHLEPSQFLTQACQKGLHDFVEMMVQDDRFDPSQNDNEPFRQAIIHKKFEIVDILLSSPKLNLKVGGADIVRQVVSKKRPDIMRKLMGRLILEPNDSISRYIFYKCSLGQCEPIQALFSANGDILSNEQVVIRACEEGMIDTLNLLLAFKEVDIIDKNQTGLLQACRNGHAIIVERLLKDPRIDPSKFSGVALIIAARSGHVNVVKTLLQDERVDPSASNNKPLRVAAENGHVEIVKLFMNDPRCDIHDMYNEAKKSAIRNKDKAMLILFEQ
jgi:ankyrin repeat protein